MDGIRIAREGRDHLTYPFQERTNGLSRVRRDDMGSEDARAGIDGVLDATLGATLFRERDCGGSPQEPTVDGIEVPMIHPGEAVVRLAPHSAAKKALELRSIALRAAIVRRPEKAHACGIREELGVAEQGGQRDRGRACTPSRPRT